jgi:hypothetical protein
MRAIFESSERVYLELAAKVRRMADVARDVPPASI